MKEDPPSERLEVRRSAPPTAAPVQVSAVKDIPLSNTQPKCQKRSDSSINKKEYSRGCPFPTGQPSRPAYDAHICVTQVISGRYNAANRIRPYRSGNRTGPTRPPEVPEARGERSTGQAVTVPEVGSQLCHQLTV